MALANQTEADRIIAKLRGHCYHVMGWSFVRRDGDSVIYKCNECNRNYDYDMAATKKRNNIDEDY